MKKILENKLVIISLLLPGMLIFLFAVISPIFYSVYLGSTDWTGIGKMNFIGLNNYIKIITDDSIFKHSLTNAFILVVALIFIQHPITIFLAALVDKIGGKWEKVFRTIFFIPCVISIIVTSKMWVSVLDPEYGMINKLLDMVGLSSLKQAWLSNPKTALWAIILIVMWQGFGWAFLLYYSGLKGISKEMYEAAKIDGANQYQVYTKVVLPLIRPIIKVVMLIAIISAFKQMETVYLTTNGGPGNTTQFVANYLYITAFNSYKYGYGNAISVIFVLICLIVTGGFNKIFKTDNI